LWCEVLSDNADLESVKTIKRLTTVQWAEVEELWALGDVTLDELSARYKLNPTYLSKQLAKRGVSKGSKAELVRERVRESIQQGELNAISDALERVRETKSEHYNYNKVLSRLLFKLIADQVKGGKSISGVKEEIRTIRDAMQALSIGRNERWSVLGLDKDIDTGEEKTTLVIKEMTADDIEAERKRQDRDFDELAGLDDEIAMVANSEANKLKVAEDRENE
jgi:hypothetical protein